MTAGTAHVEAMSMITVTQSFQATQFTKPFKTVVEFCPDLRLIKAHTGNRVSRGLIEANTSTGDAVTVEIGDWILQDADGRWSVVPDVRFRRLFQVAN